MQILEPPKTESYSTNEGHFIKTFLISTRPNQAGWKINKATGHQKVQSFIGKPFVIIPESLNNPSEKQQGHLFAESKDKLLSAYQNHTHGLIESISDPFHYNDGTDDYFYMANIKLNGSKAAAALMEHGANTWVPFSVSPHIWSNDDMVEDWEGIALSLVKQGTYGPEATISKYCKGETDSCTKGLAASKLCEREDSSLAASITSLVTLNDNNSIMSAQVQEIPQTTQVKEIPTQPIQEKKEDVVSLTKEQHETLLKEKEEKEQLKQQLAQLVNENKTTKLNTIFKSVKDESLKKTLIEKYFNADVNQLNDFYGDVTNHVLPSLVEEAKAQAEQDIKNKTIEENKGKSKAASLPKEPVAQEEPKQVVPNSVNEVKRFRQIMEAGF